jgi:hypothetical protein
MGEKPMAFLILHTLGAKEERRKCTARFLFCGGAIIAEKGNNAR